MIDPQATTGKTLNTGYPSLPLARPTQIEQETPGDAAVIQGEQEREELVPVRLQLRATAVEESREVPVPAKNLESALDSRRFLVIGEQGRGFTEEEKLSILGGKSSTFDARLNVCIHAQNVIEMFEGAMGTSLEWPTKLYHHYQNEAAYARQEIEGGKREEKVQEKFIGFVKDHGREPGDVEDSRVFINISPGDDSRKPSFSVSRLMVNLSPFPAKPSGVKMLHPHTDTDTVAHEVGHLGNACIRPGWSETSPSAQADLETKALQEAFADLSAMFYALKDRHNCEEALKETEGDLSKSSRISRIAEDDGADVNYSYFSQNWTSPDKRFLRDLANGLAYVPPEEAPPLPWGQPNVGGLYRDYYSYSQVFSGAIYDVTAGMFEKEAQSSPDKALALMKAGEQAQRIFTRSVELSPWWKPDLKTMARCLLQADMLETGGQNGGVIRQVMQERKLMSAEEADAALKDMKNLPRLNVDQLSQDTNRAMALLSEKGLLDSGDGATLSLEKKYQNDKGETTAIYTMERPPQGPVTEQPFDLGMLVMSDAIDFTPRLSERGSLVMRFDSDGNLIYRHREDFQQNDASLSYLKLNRDDGSQAS
jgi:hypothetical protein